MKTILSLFKKEQIIVFALGLLLELLKSKPQGKVAEVLFEEKTSKTIQDINLYYSGAREAFLKSKQSQ